MFFCQQHSNHENCLLWSTPLNQSNCNLGTALALPRSGSLAISSYLASSCWMLALMTMFTSSRFVSLFIKSMRWWISTKLCSWLLSHYLQDTLLFLSPPFDKIMKSNPLLEELLLSNSEQLLDSSLDQVINNLVVFRLLSLGPSWALLSNCSPPKLDHNIRFQIQFEEKTWCTLKNDFHPNGYQIGCCHNFLLFLPRF